jgi:hypothetical protein
VPRGQRLPNDYDFGLAEGPGDGQVRTLEPRTRRVATFNLTRLVGSA